MSNIDCKQMVIEYLKSHGYDGLYSPECGCEISDIMPCGAGDWVFTCEAGYKHPGNSEFDFYIRPHRADDTEEQDEKPN